MLQIRLIGINDDFEKYMRCVNELNGSNMKICDVENMKNTLLNREQNILTYVLLENDEIVAAATIIFETKLRYFQPCCHIEDVGVDPDHRKKGYGKMIVEYCVNVAQKKNCYKVKLNCSDNNVGFYNKMGFFCSSNGMEKILT